MKLRPMRNTEAELARVDRLLMTAYNSPSRQLELALYLTVQPDGWFVIADGDQVAAVAGAIAYGSFCWLGLVATDPGHRRQGLATRLSSHVLEWARERGCATIALDASQAGQPVYKQLGFQALGATLELSLPDVPAAGGMPDTVRTVDDVGELLELDRHVFGGDRTHLLQAFARDPRCRGYFFRGPNGPAGFLFARGRLLGPGCARDSNIARELVRAALNDTTAGDHISQQRLLVPIESSYLDVLLALGLRERRRLTHMRLGEPVLPGSRHQLLAQASYAVG